jgi:cytochrome c-type biogenesis protein CcmH
VRRAATFVVVAAFLAAGAALALVAARGTAPSRSMDDRVHEVAATLRCPVCRDLSVADSPSLVARQMRTTIARRLRAGREPDEIREFFVSRFGRTILLTPRGSGLDLLAWIVPGLLVAAGLFLVIAAIGRWTRRRTPGGTDTTVGGRDRELLERELLTTEDAEWT